MRDALPKLKKMGVAALGISPDEPEAQKKFADKNSLGFPLLCDTDHSIAESYGVWAEKTMFEKKIKGIVRSSFLIDEQGRLSHIWHPVSPKDTVPKLMAVLE